MTKEEICDKLKAIHIAKCAIEKRQDKIIDSDMESFKKLSDEISVVIQDRNELELDLLYKHNSRFNYQKMIVEAIDF